MLLMMPPEARSSWLAATFTEPPLPLDPGSASDAIPVKVLAPWPAMPMVPALTVTAPALAAP